MEGRVNGQHPPECGLSLQSTLCYRSCTMHALLATLLIAGPVDVARAHVAKGAFQPALDTLKSAVPLDDHEAAEAAALRASALLGLGEGHKLEASDALAAMWHLDQSGGALFSSTDAAKALAQEIRS